jgi:hypothetical protein
MQLKALMLILIVLLVLIALSMYFLVDGFNHMSESLELQKEFKPFCGGIEIVNCTARALQTVYESAQQLLVAVMELVVSMVFMILALYWMLAASKMLIKLGE